MHFSYLALLFIDFEETFKERLSQYEKGLRDKRLPRCSVRPFAESPWLYMFMSGCNQALVKMTGTTHKAFRELLEAFTPYWERYVMDKYGNIYPRKNSKAGRPRHLSAVGGLGLVLTWYKTKGARSPNLAMQFGLTNSPMACWLWFGLNCLRSALVNHPKAKISEPTAKEVEAYKDAIGAKYPSLENVWAAVDGLKLKVSVSQDFREQLINYNGWVHGHYINNIFCFAADGSILSELLAIQLLSNHATAASGLRVPLTPIALNRHLKIGS